MRLLITFANSWDPDHDRPNVGPDLDPNRLTHSGRVPERFYLEKLNFEKNQETMKKHAK